MVIDGQPAQPILTRADFVTLGAAGVILRLSPVVESLDQGIVGLTLVYETPEMADEISIDWKLFSDAVKKIEATSTDPFVSFPVDLPWVSQWKPSVERTAVIMDGLLTNVYRSFDVRDENRVYDRLAMSVMGDQLSQIYLENRQALEFENRGGARANVDDVEVLSVEKVKKSKDGGFTADVVWTVGGSVSHFGHTHYRQNHYHALVNFIMDGGTWKIRHIELIEEKRIL